MWGVLVRGRVHGNVRTCVCACVSMCVGGEREMEEMHLGILGRVHHCASRGEEQIECAWCTVALCRNTQTHIATQQQACVQSII